MKVVIFSEISWAFLKQRHHFVVELFLKKNYEVVFIERVYSRIPTVKELILKIIENFRRKKVYQTEKVPGGLKIEKSIFFPNVNFLFDFLNYYIGIYYSKKHYNAKIVYTFNNNPNILMGFTESIKIFDIIHNWWMYGEHRKWQINNVNKIIACADIVIVDNNKLIDKVEEIDNNKRTIYVPPGVSEEWLNIQNVQNHKKCKGLFFGNLRSNSDLDLIVKIIDDGIDIDLYGIIDSSINPIYKKKLEKNFKGRLPNSEITLIIKNYNFLLLPYARNKFSSTISPAKYFECLSTGLAVVSNSHLNHLPGWAEFVIDYDGNKSKFENKIINDRGHIIKQQKELAKNFTWENNFSELFELIEKNEKN